MPLVHMAPEHSPEHHRSLRDRPILVLEDQPFMAVDVAITLEDAGACPLNAANCEQAHRLIDGNQTIAGAVLDVNLGGQSCRSVAERLQREGVPFVLYTIHPAGRAGAIAGFDATHVSKPASPERLLNALLQAVERATA